MEKEEAFGVLKLDLASSREDIEDAIELEVFQIKDYILRNTIVPKVFRNKNKVFYRLAFAQAVLLDLQLPQLNLDEPVSRRVELKEFVYREELLSGLRQYEKERSRLNLLLSAESKPLSLFELTDELIDLQLTYYALWPSISREAYLLYSNNLDDGIKIANQTDTGVLIRFLSNDSGLTISNETIPENAGFIMELCRIHKIIESGLGL